MPRQYNGPRSVERVQARLYYRKHNAVVAVHAGLPEGFCQNASDHLHLEIIGNENRGRSTNRGEGGTGTRKRESEERHCLRTISDIGDSKRPEGRFLTVSHPQSMGLDETARDLPCIPLHKEDDEQNSLYVILPSPHAPNQLCIEALLQCWIPHLSDEIHAINSGPLL